MNYYYNYLALSDKKASESTKGALGFSWIGNAPDLPNSTAVLNIPFTSNDDWANSSGVLTYSGSDRAIIISTSLNYKRGDPLGNGPFLEIELRKNTTTLNEQLLSLAGEPTGPTFHFVTYNTSICTTITKGDTIFLLGKWWNSAIDSTDKTDSFTIAYL